MSTLAKHFVVLAAIVCVCLIGERRALSATCGNGYCEPGENGQKCKQDCICQDNASEDLGLCCCCANDPAPQGKCTPKAVCGFPEIGGCCCASPNFWDPSVCDFCAPKDQINGWCSGGIGAYEGKGSCGPGTPAPV